MLTVVTGWSPRGYDEYGRRFAESFHKHWPKDVELVVYGEQAVPLPRGEFRTLDSIPGAMDFIEKYRGDKAANGKEVMPWWKEKCKSIGYNWKFDAWKFCRQGFIPWAAAQSLKDGDLLCWLDGDVVTFKDVPKGAIEGLLPDGYDVAYLGRHPKHSEIGFQLYRVGAGGSAAMKMFSDYYNKETVFRLKEWHSAFVFDTAVFESGARGYNLTPKGDGHVWFQSPLGKWTDHLKGARKTVGRSMERRA